MSSNMTGTALLALWRDEPSDEAFAELVRRYAGLVYSTARRRMDTPARAEAVAQLVFARLAQTPPRVGTDAELAGWLHETTLGAARDAGPAPSHPPSGASAALTGAATAHGADELWRALAPQLDVAISELGPIDRQSILLRFFERRSVRELSRWAGGSENAAQVRVQGAVDRLRVRLAQSGLVTEGATLAVILTERGVEAPPEEWVARLTSQLAAASTPVPASPTRREGILARIFRWFS